MDFKCTKENKRKCQSSQNLDSDLTWHHSEGLGWSGQIAYKVSVDIERDQDEQIMSKREVLS